MRKVLAIVVGVAVLVLSPIGYFMFRDRFSFGEPEMAAAVVGTWNVAYLDSSNRAIAMTVRQRAKAQHSSAAIALVRTAAACDNRSFVRPAGACMDTSTMPLDIAFEIGDDGSGELLVTGLDFKTGLLRGQVGENRIQANITPYGFGEGQLNGHPVRLHRLSSR